MGRPFPHKIAHSHGGSGPPTNTWFLGPTWVHNSNSISIGSAVFAGLTIVTDRPTDRPRYSVCNNRPHLRSTAMRPNMHQTVSWPGCIPDHPGELTVNVLLMPFSRLHRCTQRYRRKQHTVYSQTERKEFIGTQRKKTLWYQPFRLPKTENPVLDKGTRFCNLSLRQ